MSTAKSYRLPPDRRNRPVSFMRSAGSFVPSLTKKAFEKYGFHRAEIMTGWERIVGADLAAFTAPERIKWPRATPDSDASGGDGATLVLRVEPSRALDIQYRAAEVADCVNRYFGYRAIASIKIMQAPLDRTARRAVSQRANRPASLPNAHTDDFESALGRLQTSIALKPAADGPVATHRTAELQAVQLPFSG